MDGLRGGVLGDCGAGEDKVGDDYEYGDSTLETGRREMHCHDITLSRGCLIAGLLLILAERVEHHYKSMGWSLFHEIT